MQQKSISKKFLEIIPFSMGLVRSYIRTENDSEFSFPKFRILARSIEGPCTVSELAEVMCVSRPAISKLVDSLVEDNYLCREVSRKDRRVTNLSITREGEKKFQAIRNSASNMFSKTLKELETNELKELEKALDCIESFVIKVQET